MLSCLDSDGQELLVMLGAFCAKSTCHTPIDKDSIFNEMIPANLNVRTTFGLLSTHSLLASSLRSRPFIHLTEDDIQTWNNESIIPLSLILAPTRFPGDAARAHHHFVNVRDS